MADGLIDIIQSRLPQTAVQATGNDNKWVKIYDMKNEIGIYNTIPWQNTAGVNELEVFGEKFNVKNERRIHRRLCDTFAAAIINRNIR